VTRFRLRSVLYFPLFVLHANRTIAQIRKADGFLAGVVQRDADLAFWTLTLWRDEHAMRAYGASGAHRARRRRTWPNGPTRPARVTGGSLAATCQSGRKRWAACARKGALWRFVIVRRITRSSASPNRRWPTECGFSQDITCALKDHFIATPPRGRPSLLARHLRSPFAASRPCTNPLHYRVAATDRDGHKALR
jgi:hypothetical protein